MKQPLFQRSIVPATQSKHRSSHKYLDRATGRSTITTALDFPQGQKDHTSFPATSYICRYGT
eukprot:scaffold4944_cov104-Skeletonema_dohrnii-CCMP3373.AAC.4